MFPARLTQLFWWPKPTPQKKRIKAACTHCVSAEVWQPGSKTARIHGQVQMALLVNRKNKNKKRGQVQDTLLESESTGGAKRA